MTHHAATASLGAVSIDNRGSAVRARREHLGMNVSALAKRAGVDRGKLARFEEGKDEPTTRWIASVERALDAFEAETGHDQGEGAAERPTMIRVEVQGVYGAKALIVEAPPENMAELEQMVDRIMRNLQDGPEASP